MMTGTHDQREDVVSLTLTLSHSHSQTAISQYWTVPTTNKPTTYPWYLQGKSPQPSTPAIPRPKHAFTQEGNSSLEDTLLLCHLLNDRNLEVPILTYCQLGSSFLTLYLIYQANRRLEGIQASNTIQWEQEVDLINAFHSLGGFQFLQELHHLPTHYYHPLDTICLTCYHKGHYQQQCVHYQCVSCLHWQPTHKALNCPCNYQSKTSPSHPHNPPLCHLLWISKKNSFSSTGSLNQATTSCQGKMVKKPHLTDFKIIPVPSLEGKGKKKEENPTFGNDTFDFLSGNFGL